MDRWMDEWREGGRQREGWTDGEMDEWTDGWTDRWAARKTESSGAGSMANGSLTGCRVRGLDEESDKTSREPGFRVQFPPL